MKTKLTRILGVGLTLALLASFVVAPLAGALSQPTATLTAKDADNPAYVISKLNTYTIVTTLGSDLPVGGKIVVDFPATTDLTDVTAADVTLSGGPGIGSSSFDNKAVTTVVKSADATTGPKLTITVPEVVTLETKIGRTAIIEIKVTDVRNPPAVGSYTLSVGTLTSADAVIEAAVASPAYATKEPTIAAVPGIVEGYNSAGVLLYRQPGNVIGTALGTAGVVRVVVGPGNYTESITISPGDTVVASGSPADTALTGTVAITATGVTATTLATLEGLKVTGAVTITGPAVVKNNSLTAAAGPVVTIGGGTGATTPATLSGNTITAPAHATATQTGLNVPTGQYVSSTNDKFVIGATTAAATVAGTAITSSGTLTLTSATVTGASGVGLTTAAETATVKTSSFTNLTRAINATGGTTNVTDSTIDTCGFASATAPVAAIEITGAATVATISGSTIKNGPEAIARVNTLFTTGSFRANFNTLTGNTKAFVIATAAVGSTVNATNNWWGVATGPAVASSTNVTTSPFLRATASKTAFTTTATTVGTQAANGVIVSSSGSPAAMAVAQYDANPATVAPSGKVIKYVDVYVAGSGAGDTVTIQVFGSTDINAQVYAWSATNQRWVLASGQAYSQFTGAVNVTVTAATTPTLTDLTALEFALVEPAVAPLGAPALTSLLPAFGADEVKLKPTFVWGSVTRATGYEFVLAEEIGQDDKFAIIDYSATTVAPGHVARESLKYSTTYNWRVRAVTATEKGAWVTSFFTTEPEPEPEPEPVPPVIVKEQPPAPAPEIILEVPPTEAPVQVIPDYLLWTVVGVGAVLVIAVIVLIVRTRRVA